MVVPIKCIAVPFPCASNPPQNLIVSHSRSLSLSLTHALTLSLSRSHSLSMSHSLSHSVSMSHSLSDFVSVSLSHCTSLFVSVSLSLTLSLTLFVCSSPSVCLSLWRGWVCSCWSLAMACRGKWVACNASVHYAAWCGGECTAMPAPSFIENTQKHGHVIVKVYANGQHYG